MTEEPAGKPWRWPGVWFRQESFWRDVASRTLAAVFAAGIVYVFAVAGGYVSKPNVLPFVALLAWFIPSVYFYAKSSKLNPNGWYGRWPTWLLRILEWVDNIVLVLILIWIFKWA